MNKTRDYLNSLFSHAVGSMQAGDLELAEKTFAQILREFPNHPDALHFTGVIYSKKGDHEKGIEWVKKAISFHDKNPVYHINLSRIYMLTKAYEESIKCLDRALELSPGMAEAYFHKGNVLRAMGRIDECIDAFKEAITLEPRHFQAHYNLGNAHLFIGNYKSAENCYQKAVELKPDYAQAHNNLGIALQEWDNWDEAERHYQAAISSDPGFLESFDNLAQLFERQGKPQESATIYKDLSIKKSDPWLQLKAELVAPVIPVSTAEIDEYRTRTSQILDHFLSKAPEGDVRHFAKLGLEPSSMMIYQGLDDRPIKEKFGQLFGRYIPEVAPDYATGKIGIVVTKAHEGVFLKCMGELVRQLSSQFDITLICSFPNGEKILRPEFEGFKVNYLSIPKELDVAVNMILKEKFQVLHYWEVGTDAANYFLAAFKLAPIQYGSWGWPVTSGLKTMDYFLSSVNIEPEDGQRFYSEKLICMDRLPIYYPKPVQSDKTMDLSFIGLPEGKKLYLCPQNLRKVHPDFDQIVGEIIDQDPSAMVLFINDKQPNVTELLSKRLAVTVTDMSRVIFLDRMSREAFLRLHELVNVVLDTLYYTGGANSNYDAFSIGTPVVTLPSGQHRGNFTAAAYQQMGISDLVASDKKEYVQKAVGYANNQELRREISQNITSSIDKVLLDKEAVEAYRNWWTGLIT